MWTPEASDIVTAAQRQDTARATLVERFRIAIQAHVDEVAKARRYDNGVSLASYVASGNAAWAAEAQAFVAWRDFVWAYAYAELDKVTAEPPQRAVPTVEEFIDELPAMVWPEPEGE